MEDGWGSGDELRWRAPRRGILSWRLTPVMGWGSWHPRLSLRNITELDLLMPYKTHPGSDASALFRGLLEGSRGDIAEC